MGYDWENELYFGNHFEFDDPEPVDKDGADISPLARGDPPQAIGNTLAIPDVNDAFDANAVPVPSIPSPTQETVTFPDGHRKVVSSVFATLTMTTYDRDGAGAVVVLPPVQHFDFIAEGFPPPPKWRMRTCTLAEVKALFFAPRSTSACRFIDKLHYALRITTRFERLRNEIGAWWTSDFQFAIHDLQFPMLVGPDKKDRQAALFHKQGNFSAYGFILRRHTYSDHIRIYEHETRAFNSATTDDELGSFQALTPTERKAMKAG
jgi:hypothetical protein